MNKTALTAAAALVVGVAILPIIRYNGLVNEVAARFPHLDRKVVAKAYATFMKNAAAGMYKDMDDFDDSQMDALFLGIVQKQTASQ